MTICAITVALLPMLYAAGYLPLGPDDPSTPGLIDRRFSNRWLALVYIPMGFTEARCRGTAVRFDLPGDSLSDPYANSMITFEP